MQTYTVKDIRRLDPCYDPVTGRDRSGDVRRTTGLLPNEDWSGTLIDILDVADCPEKDRQWVVFKLLDSEQRQLLACQLVRKTPLRDGRTVWDLLDDERSRAMVDVAERYANGKATRLELERSDTAAYYAWSTHGSAAAFAAWVVADANRLDWALSAAEYAVSAVTAEDEADDAFEVALAAQIAIARAFLLERAETIKE